MLHSQFVSKLVVQLLRFSVINFLLHRFSNHDADLTETFYFPLILQRNKRSLKGAKLKMGFVTLING